MSWFVIGGAGFIGSHLCEAVDATVYDLAHGQDARHIAPLTAAMTDHDTVVLLASNPDLAAAATDPDLDYRCGTTITRVTLEAMRFHGIKRLIYASGSGVYGDQGYKLLAETDIAMPISPYGASKLASEALINAYAHLGYLDPLVLRFANVTGPRLTHGVVYDFVRKLRADSGTLEILGDGHQSKPYIHVSDVVKAITSGLSGTFNVTTDDYLFVKEIAMLAAAVLGVNPVFEYTGGRAGWPGDVPAVRMDSSKLRATGWEATFTSAEAVVQALQCA